MSGVAERSAWHAAADALVDYAEEHLRDKFGHKSAAALLHEMAEGSDSYKHPELIVHFFWGDQSEPRVCAGEGVNFTVDPDAVTCGWCRVEYRVTAEATA